ncbi:hypothetical protein D9M69_580310 [compost metagenome]
MIDDDIVHPYNSVCIGFHGLLVPLIISECNFRMVQRHLGVGVVHRYQQFTPCFTLPVKLIDVVIIAALFPVGRKIPRLPLTVSNNTEIIFAGVNGHAQVGHFAFRGCTFHPGIENIEVTQAGVPVR